MEKNTSVIIAIVLLVAVTFYAATNRFAAPNQQLVASTDVTVRATAPTVNDDIDLNFLRGYVWIDTTGNDVYIAQDVTNGAAVWTSILSDGFTASYRVCASDALQTTNCDYLADGTEDEATINTALAACPASGCLIYLSDGTFNIAESVGAANIILIDDNQHIVGSGVESTLLKFTDGRGLGVDRYMFSTTLGVAYGTTDFSLSNFAIEAQDATDHGIRIKGAQNGTLANLKITHLDTTESNDEGIQFSGADGDSVRNINVYNVVIDGFGTHNIEFASDVRDVNVWNLVTRNSDASGLNFRNGNCSGALFDAINCVDSTNTDDPRNITFWGLNAYDNGTNGIAIDRGLDLTFYGTSSFSNDNHGLSASGGYPTRVVIDGGVFSENQLTGIWTDGSEWTISNVMIIDNAQNTGALANNRNGLRIAGSDMIVRDSRIIDDQSSKTHRYAIRVDGGATNFISADNFLEAGSVGLIDDAGTGTLIANFDYSTVQDEGSDLTQRRILNFTGAGVSCADNAGSVRTDCTISSGGGGYDTIQDETTPLTQRTTVNFTGAGVTCVDNAGATRTDCTITSGGGSDPVDIEEDNVLEQTDATVIDFQSEFNVTCAAGECDVSLDAVDISDDTNLAAGTGATLTGDTISVDLGVAIDTTEITDDTILEIDLDLVDTPVDEECLTYESGAGGDFEWQSCLGTLADDNVWVGNGSSVATATAIPDCDVAGNALNYDITTNVFSCATGYLTTVDISDNTNLVAGTNITLTGDTLSVDDVFILNTGDVGTGAYDFGGASDFEIPNGAAITPNAAGEIGVDTTDDTLTYYGTAQRVLTYEFPGSFALEDPADADSILMWKVPYNITIITWNCIVDPADTGESVVLDLQETDSSGDTGVSIDTTVTCTNTGATDDGTLSNPTIDAGDFILIDVGTVTGTVSWVTGSFIYSVDAS